MENTKPKFIIRPMKVYETKLRTDNPVNLTIVTSSPVWVTQSVDKSPVVRVYKDWDVADPAVLEITDGIYLNDNTEADQQLSVKGKKLPSDPVRFNYVITVPRQIQTLNATLSNAVLDCELPVHYTIVDACGNNRFSLAAVETGEVNAFTGASVSGHIEQIGKLNLKGHIDSGVRIDVKNAGRIYMEAQDTAIITAMGAADTLHAKAINKRNPGTPITGGLSFIGPVRGKITNEAGNKFTHTMGDSV